MILKKKKKKLDQEKVIEELLKRRSLGEDLENSYMYKSPYLADAVTTGVAPTVVNKIIADSNENTSAYDRAEENDAILSNATKKTVRDALIGGLVGGGLGALAGAGAGAAFGGPKHQLESVMSGAGTFGGLGLGIGAGLGGLYGGLSGAFRGREIARKRRENQRQLIKDALQIAKNRNFSEENTIDLIQTINENPVAASSIIGGLAGGTLGAGTSLLMGDKSKSKTRRLLEGLAIGGLGGAGLGALGGHLVGKAGMQKITCKAVDDLYKAQGFVEKNVLGRPEVDVNEKTFTNRLHNICLQGVRNLISSGELSGEAADKALSDPIAYMKNAGILGSLIGELNSK